MPWRRARSNRHEVSPMARGASRWFLEALAGLRRGCLEPAWSTATPLPEPFIPFRLLKFHNLFTNWLFSSAQSVAHLIASPDNSWARPSLDSLVQSGDAFRTTLRWRILPRLARKVPPTRFYSIQIVSNSPSASGGFGAPPCCSCSYWQSPLRPPRGRKFGTGNSGWKLCRSAW